MIIVYSQDGCAPCQAMKQKLTAKNIEFKECNLSKDPGAKDLLVFFGIRSVPAVFKDGKPIDPNTL